MHVFGFLTYQPTTSQSTTKTKCGTWRWCINVLLHGVHGMFRSSELNFFGLESMTMWSEPWITFTSTYGPVFQLPFLKIRCLQIVFCMENKLGSTRRLKNHLIVIHKMLINQDQLLKVTCVSHVLHVSFAWRHVFSH